MSSSINSDDESNGWEAIANGFISSRSSVIGAATVENWVKPFDPGQAILDVGCGFGGSYTQCLIKKGIDASTTLIQEYQKRFPGVLANCEAAEVSSFFGRKFDGILSVGLVFLLSHEDQLQVLQKMAFTLNKGGKLLFSSPYQICDWEDLSTGRMSMSLGRKMYTNVLQKHGVILIEELTCPQVTMSAHA